MQKFEDGGSIKKLEDIDKGDTIYYLNNELTVNSLMQWSDGSIESITALRKSDNKIFVLNKNELKHVSLKPSTSEDSKSNVTYYDVRYNKIVNEESIPEIKTFTDKKLAEDFAKKHYTQVDVRTKKYEDGGSVEDVKFNYMMLGRLRSDCDYYLGNGNRSERRLRGENVNEHIKEMKRLWNNLKVKPEWLSMEDIEEYERKMKNEYEDGGEVHSKSMKEFNAYGKTFLVAENGVVKKVKDYYNNGTIKEVEVKGNIYKYNSTYKTYNDAKNNILSAKDLGNDIDLFEKGGGVGLTKNDIEILGIPRSKINEKEWQSILRMAKLQDGATFILKDEKGLDVVPQTEYEWYIKDKYAKGGTILDAKSIFAKYEKNEDNNYHAENIVLLAKHFGTDEDIDTANKIIKQRSKLGYMPKDMSEKSSEISKRLYPKLIQELNQKNKYYGTRKNRKIRRNS
jgi:hypothetical protein